ncbi:hypothetical protein JTB14_032385 [Gonioctena quinquepunctata]|nr:hypothetical protein JTB14_032385 [Gonioctena quinquepunctata]
MGSNASNECLNPASPTPTAQLTLHIENTNPQEQNSENHIVPPINIPETNETNQHHNIYSYNPPTTSKRTISDVITPPPITTEIGEQFPKPSQKAPKKIRHSHPTDLEFNQLMAPTKELFKDGKLPITFEGISDFFENSTGTNDLLSLAKTYTSDIPALLEVLKQMYPCFTDKRMKTKCTKIQRKIRKQIEVESIELDYEAESDVSQDSSQGTF